MDLLDHVRSVGAAAGLAGVGVCRADPFLDTRADLEARVAAGLHGGLRFTYADPETATDVRASFPWAERLVVAAYGYVPGAGNPGPGAPGTGRVARFAETDHYRGLRSGLAAVAATLLAAGHRAEVLVDDNRLVDRAAAVRAGIGWWGRSTMVLAPGPGPWLLLGSVVTDAELPIDEPMRRDCGTCVACLPACPTGALTDGVLDAAICLAHRLQAAGMIPPELREAVGDRVYGCDDCLEACPPGRRALGSDPAVRGRVDLIDLLAASDARLLREHAHWYIPRRHPRHLRRNALVALGTTGGRRADLVAAGYLGHPDWLLRAHAAWALGRLGGPVAGAALRAATAAESDTRVAAEVAAALGSLA
ncbi:MAG: 4Fe-4S double cluster binding domain-containing protein [Actinomycetota bacterium]